MFLRKAVASTQAQRLRAVGIGEHLEAPHRALCGLALAVAGERRGSHGVRPELGSLAHRPKVERCALVPVGAGVQRRSTGPSRADRRYSLPLAEKRASKSSAARSAVSTRLAAGR